MVGNGVMSNRSRDIVFVCPPRPLQPAPPSFAIILASPSFAPLLTVDDKGNIGDSLSHFTAGVLRSNLHRVIGAPGEQASSTRWSLVYFSRPEDDVVLKVLEGSEVVEEAEAQRRLRGEGPPGGEGLRAGEWIIRRACEFLSLLLFRHAFARWGSGLGKLGFLLRWMLTCFV